MTYSEKLKDPRWQKKRLEVLSRDNFSCFWCGDTKSTLHVHHEEYIGKNPWDTDIDCLITLCDDCHNVEHLPLTELERHLIQCLRSRDRGQTSMVKLSNKVIRRFKNMPIEKDLIVEKDPF